MNEIITIKTEYSKCYLIKGSNGYIMIDTGVKEGFNQIISVFNKLNIKPKDIKKIILTHAHFDHCGNAKRLKELSGCEIVAHKDAVYVLKNGCNSQVVPVDIRGEAFLKYKENHMDYDPIDVDIVIDDGFSLIDFGIKGEIVSTPGHTSDSISIIIDDCIAFVGDLIVGRLIFRTIPRKPVFAINMKEVVESLNKLIRKGVQEIYIAHGGPFNLKQVTRNVLRELEV